MPPPRSSHAPRHRHISAASSSPPPLHGGFRLFGVRLSEPLPSPSPSSSSSSSPTSALRKSVSLGNLSSYGSSESAASQLEHTGLDASLDGYVSDDLVLTTSNARERKKGVPWTEEEHCRFLIGLQKLGKGDWRGISRNFVKTRTPTQVASHAQKYFIRQNNLNKRRRRSSLFDIIPETGDDGTEESATEAAYVSPSVHQLNLGHGGFCNANSIAETELNPSVGIPVGVLPVTEASSHHDEVMEEAGEETWQRINSGGACSFNFEEDGSLRPVPSAPRIDGAGFRSDSGAISNRAGLSFPFFQLLAWPRPSGPHPCPDYEIVKPTAVMPPAKEESQRVPEPGPVMKPSPLSYKLLEDSSRQSAFHTMPSGSRAEMDTKESLSSAIRVA